MSIAVLGAGAFGTALAIALAQGGHQVYLWGRDVGDMIARRENAKRLPGVTFPTSLRVTDDLPGACDAQTILLAIPAQLLGAFVGRHRSDLDGKSVVACCKGIDIERGIGPVSILDQALPRSHSAILTGPSFAADIARGLPTALTLACADAEAGSRMQHALSTPSLRLYLSTDPAGAELGGALKNVIAIACGAAMGAGLGDSARAAVMTRGFAEMQRLAPHFGADQDTLNGLSGLGDLALTCTSDLSRNYRFGFDIGRGAPPDPTMTVEGASTAQAVLQIASQHGLDVPICTVVAGLSEGSISPDDALRQLMSRPLRGE